MRDLLTVERIANTIRMQKSTFQDVFLLVEGDSDKKVYERFVEQLNCRLEICKGKPSSKERVISVLNILNQSNFSGIIGIIDADFDRLENIKYNNLNLFLTDTHDLETMLIKSPAFDKIIAEFGSEEKLKKFNQDLREILLESGKIIGYLRWISKEEKLNLTFQNIKFSKFINEKNLTIDQKELIKEVKNKSQYFSIKDDEFQQKLDHKISSNNDLWQVCCGHDLVNILAIALCKVIGNNNTNDVKSEIIERSLRLAYEENYFLQTNLYHNLKMWENNNQKFLNY